MCSDSNIMQSCHLRLWSAGSTKAGGDINNSDSSSDEEEEEEQGERRPVSQLLTCHVLSTPCRSQMLIFPVNTGKSKSSSNI